MKEGVESERADIESAMALLCPDWELPAIGVEAYLSGGYRNRNYRLSYGDERFVLRIAQLPSAMDFSLERVRLDALAAVFPQTTSALELNFASVIAAHTPRGLLLTRWIDAPLLSDTAGVSAETLGAYLALLHQSLHDLPANCTGPIGGQNDLLTHIRRDLVVACGSQAQADELLADLPDLPHPMVECHLDLNPWNLLTDGKSWVTLDWETLGRADPLFDLVALCDGYLRAQDLGQCKERFAHSALDTYARITQQRFGNQALAHARIVYQWREYAWAAAQVVQGNTRDEIVAQREHFAGLLITQGFNVLPG